MVRLPDGSRYGPVLLYQDIPFAPDQTIGVTGMTHQVPGGAPEGHYEYTIYHGDYPSAPADSCTFPFWKQTGDVMAVPPRSRPSRFFPTPCQDPPFMV